MKDGLDSLDIELIGFLQGDIPLVSRPYASLASSLGIPEEDIAARIQELSERGILRRYAAILKHQKAGYTVNAMVAWKVDEDEADKAGSIMASFREVSHCYLRPSALGFPYNLYTMIHTRSGDELARVVAALAEAARVGEFQVLTSQREYKKVSMKYF